MLSRCCRAAASASVLARRFPLATHRPLCLASTSGGGPDATVASTATSAIAVDNVTTFAPSYSRRARRERLQEALASAAGGGEFVVPTAEPQVMPGACGAVLNVLREGGPLKTQELFDAVEARYPGVVRSKTHLKQKILKSALVNKVMKVKLPDADRKNRWAVRRPGQIRMRIARELGQ